MFAPPPVQLSRAEVAARLEARRNAAAAGPITRPTSTGSDKSSLRRHDSRSPASPSKHHVFSKGSKIKVSSPVSVSSPTSPQPPKKSSSIFKFTAGEEVDSPDLLDGFGEHPRQAPEPPRRGTRPPSDFFERRTPAKRPPPQIPVPALPQPEGSPPPIPAKSPKRQLQRLREGVPQPHIQSAPLLNSLNHALSNLQVSDESSTQSFERPGQPRSLSAPFVSVPEVAMMMVQAGDTRTSSTTLSGTAVVLTDPGSVPGSKAKSKSGRGDGKIDKPASKRDSAVDSIRDALLEYNELKFLASQELTPRRATEGDIDTTMQNNSFETEVLWKRRKKGEAIERLLEAKSTPEKVTVFEKYEVDAGVPLPPPLSLINKELPATPTSIMATPTELYQVVPSRPSRQAVLHRNTRHKKRSPLAPISITHVKANSNVRQSEDASPSRLSVIPELGTLTENSPVSSGFSTPLETQIHLRNGSVVTVSPPELTAWKRSYYIQGPIKLPKPVIVPRKDSMASLEAFQEAIAQVYQEALNIPRRRSDDACVDDVCQFFDDFGFDEVSYGGDILAVEEIQLDEVEEAPIEEEGFVTPLAEEPSPVEKVLAQEIVHVMSKPSPVPKPTIPPIQNEETLRAKGIARLAQKPASNHHNLNNQHVRKDSLTISKPETAVLPLLPLPEESMLEAVLEPSRPESHDVPMVDQPVDHQSGFDRDNDVEELDGHTFWLAPGVFPRRKGNKAGHRRQTSKGVGILVRTC